MKAGRDGGKSLTFHQFQECGSVATQCGCGTLRQSSQKGKRQMRLSGTLAAAGLVLMPAVAFGAGHEKVAVLETYADIAHAGYEDSLITARDLQKAVDALIANPTEASLAAARALLDASLAELAPAPDASVLELDEAQRSRLEALGYLRD